MLALLSPSKTLDESFESPPNRLTEPMFAADTLDLVKVLQKKKEDELGEILGVSERLAQLNFHRYKSFSSRFDESNSRVALGMFKGDVYQSFNLASYSPDDFDFANRSLIIISGLYGLIRPLDLIQPYRLEMGTRLSFWGHKDLYSFWNSKLADHITSRLTQSKNQFLVNLASVEYAKAVVPYLSEDVKVVDVLFKEYRKGVLKTIAINSKRARGAMANWIVEKRIEDPKSLKRFKLNGYYFSKQHSESLDTLTFIREASV